MALRRLLAAGPWLLPLLAAVAYDSVTPACNHRLAWRYCFTGRSLRSRWAAVRPLKPVGQSRHRLWADRGVLTLGWHGTCALFTMLAGRIWT